MGYASLHCKGLLALVTEHIACVGVSQSCVAVALCTRLEQHEFCHIHTLLSKTEWEFSTEDQSEMKKQSGSDLVIKIEDRQSMGVFSKESRRI